MSVLTLTDGLCCAWCVYIGYIYIYCILYWCPEIWTIFITWAQLSSFHLKTDIIQSPKRCILNNRKMDNVQKHSNCCIFLPCVSRCGQSKPVSPFLKLRQPEGRFYYPIDRVVMRMIVGRGDVHLNMGSEP
jgi:hypothetical protein